MKTLIVVALLALTSPALAAKANPKDFPLINEWRKLDFQCYRGEFPDLDIDVEITKAEFDKTERGKVCVAADRLAKRMQARGYCMYGHTSVGRFSRDRAHCYKIDNLP